MSHNMVSCYYMDSHCAESLFKSGGERKVNEGPFMGGNTLKNIHHSLHCLVRNQGILHQEGEDNWLQGSALYQASICYLRINHLCSRRCLVCSQGWKVFSSFITVAETVATAAGYPGQVPFIHLIFHFYKIKCKKWRIKWAKLTSV